MLNSDIIDVAIGMCLIFLMASLICTGIQEGLEAWLKYRASDLKNGIEELLHAAEDGSILQKFYEHPMIFSLFDGNYDPAKTKNLPSYIPSGSFANALIDIVARTTREGAAPGVVEAAKTLVPTVQQIRTAAQNLASKRLKSAVLVAVDHAQGDMETLKSNLEAYFNSTMDRVSGWYKRRTQKVLFAIGLLMALGLNVDAIHVANRLGQDKSLRQAVVAQAQKFTPSDADKAKTLSDLQRESFAEVHSQLTGIGLPIGWSWPPPQINICPNDQAWPTCSYEFKNKADYLSVIVWFAIILPGWVITAFAIMLGAPFWFDALNKLMVIRSTVKPSEKSPPEASKDPQPGTRAAVSPVPAPSPHSPPPDVPFEPHTWSNRPDANEGVL